MSSDVQRRQIADRLRAGGPAGVALAVALARSPGSIRDRSILQLARDLLVEVVLQPKARASADGRHLARGRNEDFLTDARSGERVEVRGWALLFGSVSSPLPMNAGLPEVILPGAVDARDFSGVIATLHHDYDAPLPGDLHLALTPGGVAFRLSNIPGTAATRAMAHMFERGELGTCSFTLRRPLGFIDLSDDGFVFKLAKIGRLTEIAFCGEEVGRGAYARTGCWLSTAQKHPSRTVGLRVLWDHAAQAGRWVQANRAAR